MVEEGFGATIIPEIAEKKNKSGKIKGDANILVFPDLDAGNIGYKLVQRFGNAKAIGPVIQGLKKEAHDLSRGCSSEDIVDARKLLTRSPRDGAFLIFTNDSL